jgi:hypothetical protein
MIANRNQASFLKKRSNQIMVRLTARGKHGPLPRLNNVFFGTADLGMTSFGSFFQKRTYCLRLPSLPVFAPRPAALAATPHRIGT